MKDQIYVIGYAWMPEVKIGQIITLREYDKENIGPITRDNVEQWLMLNAGDFKSIIDFCCTIDNVEIDWEDESSFDLYYLFDQSHNMDFSECQAGD